MNLFKTVTERYSRYPDAPFCYHPDTIRTVRGDGHGGTVFVVRCLDCPALAGSVTGPPYLEPWDTGRSA